MEIQNQGKKNLKMQWLNLMLHFSGVINKYKLKVIETTGPKIIFYGLFVLFLEIINLIIALPAYAFISSKEFAGNDKNAVGTYRLRRIMSLSAIFGIIMVIVVSIMVGGFGMVIFPGTSQASVASWDFNTPLAYHYDTSKIQIIDGAAIFKTSVTLTETIPTTIEEIVPVVEPTAEPTIEVTPEPVIELTPTPVTEPVPAPTVEPTPAPVPTTPILFDTLKQFFGIQTVKAETNSCSAMLTTITPLVVTPFVKWDGFSETANKNGGEIYYTLSGDGGVTWLHFNDGAWIDAGAENGNTATEINSHISSFPVTLSQAGAGTLMFRAKFTSDCTADVSLLSLTANYQDQPTQIISFSPETSDQTTVVTSENNPIVVAVEESLAVALETQVDISEAPSVNIEIAPTTDIVVNTNIAVPIAFSVHTVIKTTGSEGHQLYSVPGLFSLEEGPDNGLQVKVTGTDLQVVTLNYGGTGSQAYVAVGDHIIVVVYDGSKLSLYVDGAAQATLDVPIVIAPPANVSTSLGCVSAGVVLQALSLAQINANYLECANEAPVLHITQAQSKPDDGFIDISYTATDSNNDLVSLTKYEYSKTGAFEGEQIEMTQAFQDTDHDGVSGITATKLGKAHTFVWNANADLSGYVGNVYVRLLASDGLAQSGAEIFYPVHIRNLAPTLSDFTGVQTKGSDSLTLTYNVSDENSAVNIALAISSDGGVTWTALVSSASGALGDISNPNGQKTITWNAGTDLPDVEGNVTARLTATDTYGQTSVEADILVDTRAPIALTGFTGTESNTKQILWNWSPADDTNFTKYIITYGKSSDDVKNDSGDVKLWGPLKDSDLLIAGTDRTVIFGLSADTLYYAKITAYDDFGHKTVSSVVSFKTQGDIIVGEVLPDTSTLSLAAPSGGFDISIKNGDDQTEDKNVTLSLNGGEVSFMLVSNKSDLSDASLEAYHTTLAWNLCAGLDVCENGNHAVYAKFYTSFGVGSSRVSDNITLDMPQNKNETPLTSEVQDNSVLGGSVTVPAGGGSGASGPVISIVNNGFSITTPNQTSDGGSLQTNSGAPVVSGGGGVTVQSSFIPTNNSVLEASPALNVLAQSRESGVLTKPSVTIVKKSFTGQAINFEGTGIPNAKIALFIHSDQVVVYTTDADIKGDWSFVHNQNDIELAPGEHTVFAVTYDPGSKVKSKPSIVSTFEVKKNPAATVLAYTNLPTTLLTLLVLIFGAIYLYSLKKKKLPNQ